MADYGLLGGLGEGLKQGLLAYRDERKYQEDKKQQDLDRAMKDKLYKLSLAKEGYQDTGSDIVPTEATKLRALAEQAKFGREAEMYDPSSGMSERARGAYGSAFKRVGQPGLLQGLEGQSAADIKEREDLYKGLIGGEYGLMKERMGEKKEAQKQSKEGLNRATDLRKEYQGQQTVKDAVSVAAAAKKIQDIIKKPPSAAGDMSLIFNFMKLQDPGSTVREGEYANAQNAASVPDQIRNQYNRVLSGQLLNPNQRADFASQAAGLYQSQLERLKPLTEQYKSFATQYGVDPSLVTTNYGFEDAAVPQDPQIDQYAKANKLSYSQAEAILRRRGYGK